MRRIGKARAALALCAAACGLGAAGCSGFVNLLALPGILAGRDQVEPKVKLLKDRRGTVRVLAISRANADLRWGNDAIDDDLTAMFAGELAKGERLKLVKEREVRQWKDTHAKWQTKPLQSIGEDFNVDYVIELEVKDFAVADPKSPYLFQGRAKISFKVQDVKKDQLVFTEDYMREFPIGRPVPVDGVASEDAFRQSFLRIVAKELSWNVLPRPTSEINRDPLF